MITQRRPKRIWFVGKLDFGRSVAIVPCHWMENGDLQICRIEPVPPREEDGYPVGRIGVDCVLEGMQDISNMCPIEEAQQLMDAMWDAGLRPSRR